MKLQWAIFHVSYVSKFDVKKVENRLQKTFSRQKSPYAQVAQAHYENSAYINLFPFCIYYDLAAKYKSLHEKCSKYLLIAINAK